MAIDKQIRIAVRLEPELKEQFFDLCKDKAVNPSALVRLLIQNWIQEQTEYTEAERNIIQVAPGMKKVIDRDKHKNK